MSKSQYVTLSSSIPIYNTLLDHLEKLLDEKDPMYCHFSEIRNAITKGYDKLKTYYIKTDDSKVYPIATSKSQHFKFIYLNFVLNLFNYFLFSYFFPLLISVLDPRIKLNYYKKQEWEEKYIDAAVKIIKDTYNNDYQNISTSPSVDTSHTTIINEDDYFSDLFGVNEFNHYEKEKELENYLQKPVVSFKTDPLQWWKVNCILIFYYFNM